MLFFALGTSLSSSFYVLEICTNCLIRFSVLGAVRRHIEDQNGEIRDGTGRANSARKKLGAAFVFNVVMLLLAPVGVVVVEEL